MVQVVVFEYDLYVALKDETLFFLVSQFKDNTFFKLTVIKLWTGVRVKLGLLWFFTLINVKYRYSTSTWDVWHFHELNAFQTFELRWQHLALEECLEIIQISQLARLCDTFCARESLVSEQFKAAFDVVKDFHVEKDRTNGRASPTFACVTVYHEDIVFAFYRRVSRSLYVLFIHSAASLQISNSSEKWGAWLSFHLKWVTLPSKYFILSYVALSETFIMWYRPAYRSFRKVETYKSKWVKKKYYLFNWISVHILWPHGGVPHSDYLRSNESEIKVILVLD